MGRAARLLLSKWFADPQCADPTRTRRVECTLERMPWGRGDSPLVAVLGSTVASKMESSLEEDALPEIRLGERPLSVGFLTSVEPRPLTA